MVEHTSVFVELIQSYPMTGSSLVRLKKNARFYTLNKGTARDCEMPKFLSLIYVLSFINKIAYIKSLEQENVN